MVLVDKVYVVLASEFPVAGAVLASRSCQLSVCGMNE